MLRRDVRHPSTTRETECQEFCARTSTDELPTIGAISAIESDMSDDRRMFRQPPSRGSQVSLK